MTRGPCPPKWHVGRGCSAPLAVPLTSSLLQEAMEGASS